MKNEKYQVPINMYISTSYDDAELAQKFLSDYVKGFGITVDKQRNGDELYVTIDGLDEDIDALVSVYTAQYDEFKKDCKAEPSGWVSPVNFEKSKEDESMKSESNIEDLRDQTISWGTMRSEDLIPKFLGVLKTYAKDKYDEYVNENPEVLNIDGLDDETLGWIVDELFDKLDEIAPEGTYFGAHPDDGADYGFWSVDQYESKKSEGKSDKDGKDDKDCKGKGCDGSDEKCGGDKQTENREKPQEGSSASNNWIAYYFCKDPQGLEWAVLPHTVSMIGNVNCVNARGGMESIGKEYVLSKCTPVEDVESSEIWKAVCDGEDRKVVAIDRNDAERVLHAENGLEELKSVVAGKDESKKNEKGTTKIETYEGFDELLGYADAEYLLEDVVDVLSQYYTYEDETFDEDQAKDDPEFTIKIEGGDERADFYSENIFYVHLPNKEAAEELADVLDGKLEESKKSEDTYDRPVTLYASTRYDDAEEAQKFLDSISGGEVKVSKERNGDTLSVSIEGDDDAIDTFLAVYKDNYDTLEKDCDADVNGWTDPVDLKYYTVQGRKELTGESESKQNEKSKAVCAVCGEPTDDPVFDYDHTFCKDCYGDGGDVWKGDKANANAKFVVGTMISLDGVKQYIREFRPRTFVAQSVDTGKEVTLPRSSLNRAFALYDPRKSDYDDRGNLKNRESNKKGESNKSEADEHIEFKQTEFPKELRKLYKACSERFYCEPYVSDMLESSRGGKLPKDEMTCDYTLRGSFGSDVDLSVNMVYRGGAGDLTFTVAVSALDETTGHSWKPVGDATARSFDDALNAAMSEVDKNLMPFAVKVRSAKKGESKKSEASRDFIPKYDIGRYDVHVYIYGENGRLLYRDDYSAVTSTTYRQNVKDALDEYNSNRARVLQRSPEKADEWVEPYRVVILTAPNGENTERVYDAKLHWLKDEDWRKFGKQPESKKSESLTLKQKELKDMARFGQAEDITTISDEEAKALRKKGIETIGVSRGTYGMNGALLRDNEGNKYVITARSSNLFYFV